MQILNLIIFLILISLQKYKIKSSTFEEQNETIFTGLNVTQDDVCKLCVPAIHIMKNLINTTNETYFQEVLVYLCIEYTSYNFNICSNIVNSYGPVIYTVIRETNATATDFCNGFSLCGNEQSALFDWSINLTNKTEQTIKQNTTSKTKTMLKVLQITDLHIDYKFSPGSPSECLEPLCCREGVTASSVNSSTAGFWGSYGNCDIPIWTVENMFDFISKNETFDFIYWTGDLAPHDIEDTVERQLNSLNDLTNLFKKYFPNKKIYSSIGNHEGVPANIFPIEGVPGQNDTWLYSKLAKEWTLDYGLSTDLQSTIIYGGFYTVLIRSGFRLVSLNTNYCYSKNLWLYLNPVDPYNQLKWVADILQKSEDNNEKVHIISHIYPGGGECLDSFSKSLAKIVRRYKDTIVALFLGHQHNDFVQIYYENNNTIPIKVAYVSPSVTTYVNLNPGYRIYEINAETFEVEDYVTKYLDLNEANKLNITEWKYEYSAKASYGMPNLSANSWNKLVNEMLLNLNSSKTNNFIKFYHKSNYNGDCDDQCKINLICLMKQTTADNSVPCL